MSAPKLNIHCKSLFIVHQGDKVFNLPRDVKIPASKFFKCLLISKQFLRASQLYNIYEIVIGEFCDNNKFNLRLSRCGGTWSEDFQLTLEEIQQLNKLLNVQCADVFKYCYNHADKYSAVSKIFKRKIRLCLVFDDIENQVHHHEIVNQVKDQLCALGCRINSLLSSSEVPNLNLNGCALSKIDNLYQLKQVLTKQRIERLVIRNGTSYSDPMFNENIDDDYFDDFPVCPYLKKLEFSWDQLDETQDLISKITRLLPYFPNLTRMLCYFKAEDHPSEQASLQQLLDRMTKECKIIEQLRKERLPTTTIELHYLFRIRRAESINIVKQAVKQILKTTKFNQLRCFEHIKDEVKDGEDVVMNKEYYGVDVRWREPGFCTSLRFKVELSLSNENEVIEEDDTLLVPLVNCYSLD